MNKTTMLLLLAAAAMAQPGADNPGPTRVIAGSGTLKSGIMIRFATYAIPGGKQAAGYGAGGIGVEADRIHRSMVDPSSGRDFGYDLTFAGDAVHGYQAVFQPLTGAGDQVIVPKLPPPQSVKDGDTIALDLMQSADGSQLLVDYIQVSLASEPRAAVTRSNPRDYSADDGAITYDFSAATIWIDGRKWTGTQGFTAKASSATFWIAFPGTSGRYILSLVPHEGLQKAGTVRDNVIAFAAGGHEYEVRFAAPIAGAGKAWNLYLGHDANYTPKASASGYVNCGIDRYESLVSRL